MGLVTSALQIGKSALLAYESGIQVVGNNIANVGSDTYSRQSPEITPVGSSWGAGMYQQTSGVTVANIRRNVDEALNMRLRMALSDESGAQAEHTALTELEALYNSLSDKDLSSALNEFFNAWSDVENTPEELGARSVVLAQGEAIAEHFRYMRQSLANQYDAKNNGIETTVLRINEISADIAQLNVDIITAESSGQRPVSMLRDQRDALLGKLSDLVMVQVHEQKDGSINVYIDNQPLVQHGTYREMTTSDETVDAMSTAVVRWADNGRQVQPWAGKLEGQMTARDTHIAGQIAKLDELAHALIADVNRLHAGGQGLEGLTTVKGTYSASDPAVSLATADNGLGYIPTNGSFKIVAPDMAGGSQTVEIQVDLDGIGADSTLTSIAAAITASGLPISASVTADNRLKIDADPGQTFRFADDTSGVLGALGINTFFDGEDAGTIVMNADIVGKPNRVAAGRSNLAGDGTNAGAIAALASDSSRTLNSGQSLLQRYNAVMTDLATTTSAAANAVEASGVISGSLKGQWESVSGVNLDEETLMLMRYQRAFQGAARIVAVVDELLQQVLALGR